MIKPLRLMFVAPLICSLVLIGEMAGFAFQTDSRGFPITSSPGPSFGMPSVNSQFGAPQVNPSPVINRPPHPHPVINANNAQPNNMNMQRPFDRDKDRDRDRDRDRNRFHPYPFIFYYNSGYPTYYNSPDDNSYYYTNSPSDDSEDNSALTSQLDNVYSNDLPEGVWVSSSNGGVPDNAIIYKTDDNNANNYYCRATYRDQLYYGVLTPNDGCYILDQTATIRFNQYEVLVSY